MYTGGRGTRQTFSKMFLGPQQSHIFRAERGSGGSCTCLYSPLSWPMAGWFMEECIMLSDWTLGGRGGIWLPATWDVGERKHVYTFFC